MPTARACSHASRHTSACVEAVASMTFSPAPSGMWGPGRPSARDGYGAMYRDFPTEPERLVIHFTFLGRTWYYFNAPSVDRAKAVGYRWEQYRQCWWIPALLAACIFVREFLPIPRLCGRDDE